MSTSPAAANMCGYFSGLSVPSVTEMTTTLLCSPRSKSAGQTRFPTFSMNSKESLSGAQGVKSTFDHLGVEVATRAGVDLHRARPGGGDPVGVEQRLLITFDHRNLTLRAEAANGALEQGRLARAR